ncbi:CNP1-like family protein [Rhabdochromatium marinum]|uniref:CNP1-like family protein n=1 Tax=Rhabdochromatium marinum TaxID=48729 RepID=UPI001F5B316B|nr:CNP1-like family protein [Rhabdochromatium marinum]
MGLIMLSLSISTAAQNNFVNDAEPDSPTSVRDAESWSEQSFTLPAWPREQDLVPVRLDNAKGAFNYFLDTRSLHTGTDQVVRYTLVAESTSGARNLSFEGLRCTARGQYRVYAYGQNRHFEPTRLSEDWHPIDRSGADPIHEELWRTYLCVPRLFAPRPRASQLRALRQGRVGDYENSGFLTE